MHLFRRARVPCVCLAPELVGELAPANPLEPWREINILVDGNRIVSVGDTSHPAIAPIAASTDLAGAIVFPAFLDCHTHLDKCHTWDRAPNPRGEFWDALTLLKTESRNWSEEDIYRRASFALRRAWAHGTAAVRTHLESNWENGERSWAAIARLKSEWAGRIELQTVTLCGLDTFTGAEARRIVEVAGRWRATALGGFPQPNPNLAAQIDTLMAAANELGIGIDLHVDESGRDDAECLRAVAEAVLRNQFPFPVACGHCCSLALHSPERRRVTIDLVRKAGVKIISLPLCNQYLQGRQRSSGSAPETPRWRGLTTIHEFLDGGIDVACASDNVRDAFYAWGDMDVAEVLVQSVRAAHLDTRMNVAASVVTTAPARIMVLPEHGRIAVDARAEFVVFAACSFNQLFCAPNAPRKIICGENWEVRPLPDYGELT